ncbi:MAG TPA: hypothetical protein VG963_31520 [Polyangiaceae bacterium]|nr:hypothetical protein [Polyangiaceae bacterium]
MFPLAGAVFPLASAVFPLAAAALLCAGAVVLPGCGGGSDASTYSGDVRPLFSQRCTICHRAGGPSGIDIQNPFNTATAENVDGPIGLAVSKDQQALAHPELNLPAQNVAAGDPDQSFLINKIADVSLGLLPATAGAHMPYQVAPLSPAEVQTLEDWVSAGAPNGPFTSAGRQVTFAAPAANAMGQLPTYDPNAPDSVARIFGADEHNPTEYGHCIYCHYDGSAAPGDLTNPFGPDGVVNVDAHYRSDLKRVAPGDPEHSLLILKVRPQDPNMDYSDVGVQMPYAFPELSANQVDIVREWISQGAKP